MAPRLALLIAAVLLGACVRARSAAEMGQGCGSCHAAHYGGRGACADCHRGNPRAARKELAHARLLTGQAAAHSLFHGRALAEGRRLVEAAACRRCHTIGGEGNRLAADLDSVVWRRAQQELLVSITAPVESMPSFGFDRSQADALIAFLLSSGRPDAPDGAYRVHFARDAGRALSTFEDKCGGCHRLLTPLGPQGAGRQGPDLSGLLTGHYPATAPGERGWSEKVLADWLANPRALRPATIMPPVPLNGAELEQVMASIRASASVARRAVEGAAAPAEDAVPRK